MKQTAGPTAYSLPLIHFKHQREESLLSLRFDPAEDLMHRLKGGDIRAGFLLAYRLSTGQGMVADPARAAQVYRRIHRKLFFRPYKHDMETAFDKARLHHFGWGVTQNPRRAFRYFRACRRLFRDAADQGDSHSAYCLAALFFHGWGGDKDALAAVYYLRMAAESGLIHAQMDMADILWKGLGVWPDKPEAARFLDMAANNHRQARLAPLMAEAQYRMGLLRLDGLGTTVSLKDGYVWLAVAARYGHEAANEQRKAMDQKFSLSQQIEFQKIAELWRPRYGPESDRSPDRSPDQPPGTPRSAPPGYAATPAALHPYDPVRSPVP